MDMESGVGTRASSLLDGRLSVALHAAASSNQSGTIDAEGRKEGRKEARARFENGIRSLMWRGAARHSYNFPSRPSSVWDVPLPGSGDGCANVVRQDFPSGQGSVFHKFTIILTTMMTAVPLQEAQGSEVGFIGSPSPLPRN